MSALSYGYGGGVTIKDLDGDLAKLVIGAARRRVLVYTLISGVEYSGMDDTRIKTVYINMGDIKQDSAFMLFANHHLPSGTGHIGAMYKKDPNKWGYPCRWYTEVNGDAVDFDVDDETEPSNIDAMIEELEGVYPVYEAPPPGFVVFPITATFVRARD